MYLALDDREDLPEKVLTEMKLTRKCVCVQLIVAGLVTMIFRV